MLMTLLTLTKGGEATACESALWPSGTFSSA